MINPNDPAIPVHWLRDETDAQIRNYSGLTKREYFAAMAMQGLLPSVHITNYIYEHGPQEITKRAVEFSDALIAELNK